MLHLKKAQILGNEMPHTIQEWLAELTIAGEQECTSILYAKSLLDTSELSMAPYRRFESPAQRIHVDSTSTPVSLVPIKPQRRIARMMSATSEHVMTASTPVPPMAGGQRYRTMVHYRLGEDTPPFVSASAPTTPYSAARYGPPVSAFIRVQSSDRLADGTKHDCISDSIPEVQRCNCVTCEISANIPHAPVLPLRGAIASAASSRIRYRTLTPKISTQGRGQRRALRHRRPPPPYRPKPQPRMQHKLQQIITAVEKSNLANNGVSQSNNETVTDDGRDLLSDTSVCSLSGSFVKLDVSQWTTASTTADPKDDNPKLSGRSPNRNAIITSSSQPNLLDESSPSKAYLISGTADSDNNDNTNDKRSAVCPVAKRPDPFRFENCGESLKPSGIPVAAQRLPRRGDLLPSMTVPVTKPKKPPRTMMTTNSLPKKITAYRRSESADSYDVNLSSSSERNQTSHKAPNYSQLQIFRVNGQTASQILLSEPSSPKPRMTKSFSNTRCTDNNVDAAPPTSATTTSTTTTTTVPGRSGGESSDSNSSVDSGQGSAELSSQSCPPHPRDSLDCCEHPSFGKNSSLPSYARMANAMDHVLRVCSALHTLLKSGKIDEKWTTEVIYKAKVLITTMQGSPCSAFLPVHDIATVQQLMSELETERNCIGRPVVASDFLIITLRKVIQEVLLIFSRIISAYLRECTNRDRLLVIALEHLIHLMLFGDELCIVTIQCGGLDSILLLCEMSSTPNATLRLLLRALAVLCGNYRGAMKLLSLGKLELIIRLLCTCCISCSAEAAGVLTQLTNPIQNYIRLGNDVRKVVTRILEIVDESNSAEPLLLAVAALANIAVQETRALEVLYEHNAIKRLIEAYRRPKCRSIFVQEQMLTVFTCLANGTYIEALIGQDAVAVLLSLFGTRDRAHSSYCKRIHLQTAQCLRIIAGHGIGLKAIHKLNGYSVISEAIRNGDATTSDTTSILWSIQEQLEQKYHLESAV